MVSLTEHQCEYCDEITPVPIDGEMSCYPTGEPYLVLVPDESQVWLHRFAEHPDRWAADG